MKTINRRTRALVALAFLGLPVASLKLIANAKTTKVKRPTENKPQLAAVESGSDTDE